MADAKDFIKAVSGKQLGKMRGTRDSGDKQLGKNQILAALITVGLLAYLPVSLCAFWLADYISYQWGLAIGPGHFIVFLFNVWWAYHVYSWCQRKYRTATRWRE